MSVDKVLARDRELREHATKRPWHESGPGSRARLVGPLPQEPVVVDPYAPNPQDAPLILHRVNTYEELEEEIERLREALREARARLETTKRGPMNAAEDDFPALARALEARITAALGDRRTRPVLPPSAADHIRLDG